ncbi:YifB family Mg chelatase-like AAA ATPase [Nocardioides sp. InS609-2]|uniref:YifB family Mg chelatase-like AAA ATPase n=1 Tax=Nocardioides sp. InS609-2 TaxID=2760705 RepID=UPI0020BD79BC|nr:YifB family Mg chelatase-like AAA ATPase [Nocardioides sp. InS609-2]
MPFATTHTVSLQGSVGHLIEVQADVSQGIVGMTVVGRPDATLNEARDRVRMAIANSMLAWPATRRVTILLAPADLPKSGTHFDLAMAVAIKAADGLVPTSALEATVFIGELTLSGGLRSVPGVLPMVMAAAQRGVGRVFVPEPQVREAALVPGMEVFGVRSLAQVISVLSGDDVPEAPPVAPMSGARLLSWRGQHERSQVDMADLEGMLEAKYAVEVAAAGGHHLLLSGPKGAGKTTLAERIPSVLPDLTAEEALELTAIHSLAGALEPGDDLMRRPPYFAPHHDASKASLLGGGTGRVRPGAVSRAHCGVLFLDEFPLFRTDVVEALREPLEGGQVTIARGEELATFPARGMVVLAANPCPCGDYSPSAPANKCTCFDPVRRAYRQKLTGPIADRIDILRHVEPEPRHAGADKFAVRERSDQILRRVALARERQAERYAGRGFRLNSQVPGHLLESEWPLAPEARSRLDKELYEGRLTRRGAVRVHRLALTVSDLRGLEHPGFDEVMAALHLRTGEPLEIASLGRAG